MEEAIDCGFVLEGNRWFRYRAAAIIREDDCVLFAKNDLDSYYYSIGGGVHHQELAADAVRREVLEETGIAYEIDRLVFIHENLFKGQGTQAGLRCHEIAFYYLMKSRGTKELRSNSVTSDGIPEHMHWLPIAALKQYQAYPSFLASYLPDLPNVVTHVVTQ